MKILTASQIRQADAYTIANEPITSLDLMERAANAFVDAFKPLLADKQQPIKIICGMGNNGGDGLAIGRILHMSGYHVAVWVVRHTKKGSPDFEANATRIPAELPLQTISKNEEIPTFAPKDIIIDALFGSGLNRPADGIVAEVIQTINGSGAKVVSVDIASGLFADQHTPQGAIIEPDFTFTFQVPKLALLMPQNERYTGQWQVLNIGLHPAFMHEAETPYHLTQKADVQSLLKKRGKFVHKGTFGHALIIGGSYGKIGAPLLATKACLRAGAGLVTAYIPRCGYHAFQVTVPEAMVICDENKRMVTLTPPLANFRAVGIGPGLGTDALTVKALAGFLSKAVFPLVIDADALNILSENPRLQVPRLSILTPHPKEFERLAGKSANDFELLEKARQYAQKQQVFVVLKGAHTAIITPDQQVFFNSTGNPGMATGGMGDTLTGILTALFAQGYTPLEACILGVYLHGLAADLAAQELGYEALIASDVSAFLSQAYKALHETRTF